MKKARHRAQNPTRDGGPTGPAEAGAGGPQGPVRTCVGCRARTTAADLLRVVVSGGAIVPDPGHRLPGRGAYLHLDAQCLRTAERRRAWIRALRLVAPLPADAVAAHLAEVVGAPEGPAGGSTARPHDPAVPQDRT